MTRTDAQIGNLAFALYDCLSKADLTYEELKSLGESIYAKAAIDRVNKGAVKKLWLTAKALDLAFPLPDPALAVPVSAPTPVAVPTPPASTPTIPETTGNAASAIPAASASPIEAVPPAPTPSTNGIGADPVIPSASVPVELPRE